MPSGPEFAAPEQERATPQQLSSPAPVLVQRKLAVGHADDPLEHEAEAVAQRILSEWDATAEHLVNDHAAHAAHDHSPIAVHRVTEGLVSRTAGSAGGYAGGEIDQATERELGTALGKGQPLAPTLRRRYESAFGADLGGVRLHQGGQSARLNKEFGARAFTVGSDIFLGANAPELDSKDGVRLLSHELTHTLQQGNTVQRIQRDIGFEFESKDVATRQKNDERPLLPAEVADYRSANRAYRASKRVAKGRALLKKAGIEVQADDNGRDSDLEVVVDHLPETAAGRLQLEGMMDDLALLIDEHQRLNTARGVDIVGSEELSGIGGFGTPMVGGLITGPWHLAKTMPQVTLGARIGNVVDIVEDLHGAPGEAILDRADRKEGRRHMRKDVDGTTEPKEVNNESKTLSDALVTAKTAIADYDAANIAVPRFGGPGGKELAGFLTFIFAYAKSGEAKSAFLKNHTPLMAKTDLAAIWDAMPANIKTYFGHQDAVTRKTRLEDLVETAVAARIDQPLMNATQDLDEDKGLADDQKRWYESLIMRDWIRSIVTPHRTGWQKFKEFFGATKRTKGVDKLTTKHFGDKPKGQEIEGYGALGKKTDTHTGGGGVRTSMPVMELRSANRPVSFAGAKDWALNMFDYVVSLNNNPNGGHARVGNAPPA